LRAHITAGRKDTGSFERGARSLELGCWVSAGFRSALELLMSLPLELKYAIERATVTTLDTGLSAIV